MPSPDPPRDRPGLSVVVPVFNEEESLAILHGEIVAALEGAGENFEILYVDDGSTDGSGRVLRALGRGDPRVHRIALRRNFGQTAALAAGFDVARGETVVTMDADLQNDPADVPALLARIREGFDLVSGWRRLRRDAFLTRRLPSLLANRVLRRMTGLSIHDSGCTLKAYRASLLRRLPLYAEMHRFLPVLGAIAGARVSEVEVGHRARRFGRSKYGIARAFRVVLDLMTVKMLVQFSTRPLHWFGVFGLPFLPLSAAFFALGLIEKGASLVFGTVVYPAIAVLLLLTSIDLLLLGLLAELAVRAGHRRGASLFGAFQTEVE
ncbi:MAG TPA: glycosyltransferase family 2 protein [Planctomycetota bacterium]|jgi:glycosyltransferase involved in cell wall biosynthesis|nr:glycosyltransferase family 2 protein [Planctomycetota bacterium]